MARTSGKLSKAECLEFSPDRRLVDRDPKLLEQPLHEVLTSPADHAVDGRDRTAFDNLPQRLALRVV